MGFEVNKKDRSYATLDNVLRSCYGVLSLRDHSSIELRNKQIDKGYAPELVDEAIEYLIQEKYLNDQLFARGYFESRLHKGHGPMRIARDMRTRQIPGKLIEALMSEHEHSWTDQAKQVKLRKFGPEVKKDQKWKGKVFRYLAYRGFYQSDIMAAMTQVED